MSDRNGAGTHPLIAGLAAVIIVVACIGGYVWVNNKPPVHAGQVLSVTAYPIHRELSTGSGLGGVNGGNNVYDEVIVIANVRIKSQTDIPLFLHDMYGDVTLANGEVQRDLAASGSDFRKVFVAYPALAPQQKPPMPRGITLAPGQQIDGQMVFHYPISQQDWNSRKAFNIDVEFIHQKDLILSTMPNSTSSGQ